MADRSTIFVFLSGQSASQLDQLALAGRLADRLQGAIVGELRFPLQDQLTATLNTLMTGVWPDQHGILLPRARDRETASFRALSGRDRRRPAFWERLGLERQRAISVGWPCSMPTQGGGRLEALDAQFGSAMVTLPSKVFPDTAAGEAARELFETWLRPDELPAETLTALVPAFPTLQAQGDDRAGRLKAAVAENISRHAAFMELITGGDWQAATLHLDLALQLGALKGASQEANDAFAQIEERGQMALAEMLAAVLGALPSETNIILAGLPTRPSDGPGRVLFHGHDFRSVGQTISVSALDLAPTIWMLCGWSETGYPGRALMEILPPEVLAKARRFRAQWRPPEGADPLSAEQALLDQLNPTSLNPRTCYSPEVLHAWQAEWNLTLIRSHVARGAYLEVLPIIEQRVRDYPEETETIKFLAEILLRSELFEEARDVAHDALEVTPPEDADPLLLLAAAHAGLGEETEARRLLAEVEAMARPPQDHLRVAELYADWEEWPTALAYLEAHAEAMSADRRLLAEAQAHLALQQWERARDAALQAVMQNYAQARAHEALGRSLWKLGERDAAMTAFSTCACLAPDRAWPFEHLAQYGKLAGRGEYDIDAWQLQARLAREHELKLIEDYRALISRLREQGTALDPQPRPAPGRREAKPMALTGMIGLPGAGQAKLRAGLAAQGVSLAETKPSDWPSLLGFAEPPRAFEEGVFYDFPAALVTLLPREHRYCLIVCELSAEMITEDFVRNELPPVFAELDREELTRLLLREQYGLTEAIRRAPNMKMLSLDARLLDDNVALPEDVIAFCSNTVSVSAEF